MISDIHISLVAIIEKFSLYYNNYTRQTYSYSLNFQIFCLVTKTNFSVQAHGTLEELQRFIGLVGQLVDSCRTMTCLNTLRITSNCNHHQNFAFNFNMLFPKNSLDAIGYIVSCNMDFKSAYQ